MCAGVCAGVYVGMQRPHMPAPLPAAGNPLHGLRALTFLASALGPSLPGGGSVDTVKSLGSSQAGYTSVARSAPDLMLKDLEEW